MDLIPTIFRQRQEALLLGEYDAYRSQCSRRLASTRKRLGVSNSKKKYQAPAPVTPEDLSKDATYGNLLLYDAERAWAQAMHMKSQISDNPASSTPAKRSHIVSRLHKAYKLASSYTEALPPSSDDSLLLQAAAYTATFRGSEQSELSHWKAALHAFAKARIIFTILHTTLQDDIYKEQLTSTADPSVRYAAYKLQLPRQLDIAAICRENYPRDDDKRITDAVEKLDPKALAEEDGDTEMGGTSAATVSSVTWRGRTAPVEEASISLALSAAQSATPEEEASTDAFDSVLSQWQDAVDAVRKRIEELSFDGMGMAETRMQNLQLIFTYTSYALISWRVARNRVMIVNIAKSASGGTKKLAQLKEEVTLYDAILQSLESVGDLPGVAADEEFSEETAAKQAYFRALRAGAVAQSHALSGKKREALVMYHLALRCVQSPLKVLTQTPSDAPAGLALPASEMQEAASRLQAHVSQYRALVELERLESTQCGGTQGDVVMDDLKVWRDKIDFENGIVEWPPRVRPVPAKPVFLDCAWNFVQYPGMEAKMEKEITKEEKEEGKKGGLLGMFGWR